MFKSSKNNSYDEIPLRVRFKGKTVGTFKNKMKLFLRKWHRWKWNFMRWTKKHDFSVNLIGLFLKNQRICGKFVPWFYFNLRTLYRTKTHSLSITRLNVEQVKCYCSKAIIQQTSHKNIFFQKKTTQSHQASGDSQRIKFEIFWKYCDSIKTWC